MARFRRVNDTAARQAELLDAALHLAESLGFHRVTRDALAAHCSVSAGTVSRYFGSAADMRAAIMRTAVTRGIVALVAQGLAANDPQACGAPQALKQQALEYLGNR